MSEPFFIAQTFEAEHVANGEAMQAWFKSCAEEAAELGGTWPRMTIAEDGTGLLFECWKQRPKDQGAPRWQMTLSDEES